MALDTPTSQPAAPAQTQSHGTVLAAVAVGFVLLLTLFWAMTRGVGPFTAEIRSAVETAGTMTAEVTVRNGGEKSGRANCDLQLVDADGARRSRGHRFLTPKIEPGRSLTQTLRFPVDPGTRATAISC